ncbi:MAG: hypothetical protein A2Z27_01965 [candidate division Zixibacteria bacterium RBG_16_50_21]|nr:MAG: hypothetical protein A2Z27_01965 [candidate division Zixibacteria bacterium RBG_16_50_21]
MQNNNIWIYDKKWDLTFIIFSAILVPLPILLTSYLGLDNSAILVLVSFLVGGPHVYATFMRTLTEKKFTSKKAAVLLPAVIIFPIGVFYLALNNLTILLTIFFFWASVHVLHQLAYIVDIYDHKRPNPMPLWSKALDYLLIFSSIYPLASYKLVNGEFYIGKILLKPPAFAMQPWIPPLVVAAFWFLVGLFLIRTIWEYRTGRFIMPKFLLTCIVLVVSYNIPRFDNMDVAFQGYNTWHSFQYLALTWYINKLRAKRGEIANPTVRNISLRNKPYAFYAFNLGITAVAGILIYVLRNTGFNAEQSYYSIALSSLLLHYFIDHFLFTNYETILKTA